MKRFLVLAVAVFTLVLAACSEIAPPPGGGNDGKPAPTEEWPKLKAVFFRDPPICTLGEDISAANFTVYYQEDENSDEKLLDMSKEDEKYTVNGGETFKAGKISDTANKYGYQDVDIAIAGNNKVRATNQIYVVAEQVDQERVVDFKGLKIMKQPAKVEYDIGESFNASGMIVVGWFGGTEAGETDATGGVPVKLEVVCDPQNVLSTIKKEMEDVQIDISAAVPGLSDRQTTKQSVKIKPKLHNIVLKPGNGGKITLGSGTSLTAQARTGEVVSVNIGSVNDEWAYAGWGQKVTDEQGAEKSLDGQPSEQGPDPGFDKKFAFTMPRYNVEITSDYVRTKTGLDVFQYSFDGTDWLDIPGFESEGTGRFFQLVLDRSGNGQDNLHLKLGPKLVSGASVNLALKKGSADVTPAGATANTGFEYTESSIIGPDDGITYTVAVLLGGTAQTTDYTLQVNRVTNDNKIIYKYKGQYQTFAPYKKGWYKIQAWGAEGGNGNAGGVNNSGTSTVPGGEGGYVEGTIFLDPDNNSQGYIQTVNGVDRNIRQTLYLYVGGAGGDFNPAPNMHTTPGKGGWNGGGMGGDSTYNAGGGGGGATSVSIMKGAWNDYRVLAGRILVAGGGGGASPSGWNQAWLITNSTLKILGVAGGHGGGRGGSAAKTQGTENPEITYPAKYYSAFKAPGWTLGENYRAGQETPPSGDPTARYNGQGFGVGAYGRGPDGVEGISDGINGKGGGGGGWWGGRVSPYIGQPGNGSAAGGGGGSNYISGYRGCVGVMSVKFENDPETNADQLKVTTRPNGSGSRSYFVSTGLEPVEGTPQYGSMVFKNTMMNISGGVTDNGDAAKFSEWSAGLSDKAKPAGVDIGKNGCIVITYINDDAVPPHTSETDE
ncbi:MAG: hypothetical protein LBG72_03355 [Spirochaetaceae bacterium]|jgi:hypothetical protein|nr:hypothetical protein [Spirochaetaceae bacterium]